MFASVLKTSEGARKAWLTRQANKAKASGTAPAKAVPPVTAPVKSTGGDTAQATHDFAKANGYQASEGTSWFSKKVGQKSSRIDHGSNDEGWMDDSELSSHHTLNSRDQGAVNREAAKIKAKFPHAEVEHEVDEKGGIHVNFQNKGKTNKEEGNTFASILKAFGKKC